LNEQHVSEVESRVPWAVILVKEGAGDDLGNQPGRAERT